MPLLILQRNVGEKFFVDPLDFALLVRLRIFEKTLRAH
jgi:hypothetical protein